MCKNIFCKLKINLHLFGMKNPAHAHCLCSISDSKLTNLLIVYDELTTIWLFCRKIEARRKKCLLCEIQEGFVKRSIFSGNRWNALQLLKFTWMDHWMKKEKKTSWRNVQIEATFDSFHSRSPNRNFHFTKNSNYCIAIIISPIRFHRSQTSANGKLIKTDMHTICAQIAYIFAYELTLTEYKSFVRIKNYKIFDSVSFSTPTAYNRRRNIFGTKIKTVTAYLSFDVSVQSMINFRPMIY